MKETDKFRKIAENAMLRHRLLANTPESTKNDALASIAEALLEGKAEILRANSRDVKKASSEARGSAFIDRLLLDEERIEKMAESVETVRSLPDPVGAVVKTWRRPNGLEISRVRVPIGVILIIYESRPDVGVQASSLCLKSGNCVILRGGSDASESNRTISEIMGRACAEAGVPPECVQSAGGSSRESVLELLKLEGLIDLVIPRGGEGLIRMVSENSRIPVMKHYKGICHIYLDSEFDPEMARKICLNAKVQRPGVCNAMETMLVHKDAAERFLPGMLGEFKDAGVEIRGDERVRKTAGWVRPATPADWDTEHLDLILSVRVVDSMEEAVGHIEKHGSGHSDAIITSRIDRARKFVRIVDSAAVYVNASTRFTDGGEFGFGAEIGISTDRLHARGPVGLEELTSYKYVILGDGQVRT